MGNETDGEQDLEEMDTARAIVARRKKGDRRWAQAVDAARY